MSPHLFRNPCSPPGSHVGRLGRKVGQQVAAPFDDREDRHPGLSPAAFKARHLADSVCVGLAEWHDRIDQTRCRSSWRDRFVPSH